MSRYSSKLVSEFSRCGCQKVIPSKRGVFIKSHNFQWNIIEKDFCSMRYPKVKTLIVVHTAIPHFHARQAHRKMYGKRFYEKVNSAHLFTFCLLFNQWIHAMGVASLFFVGMPSDEEQQMQIRNESETYHDIIQQDFIDTYRNLTWKAISWLQYVNEFCEEVEFILKIDDDVVFDLIAIESYLRKKSPVAEEANSNVNMMLCSLFADSHLLPIRDSKSKWGVTKEEYAPDFFYPYCRGIFYLMPRRTAVNLLNASIGEKFFWFKFFTQLLQIDDYFITGHLSHKIGVVFDNIMSFQSGKEQLLAGRSWLWVSDSQNMTEAVNIWQKLEESHKNASSSVVLSL
ncbi:unnamed protein product [Anisakis simplex]|uniref:Hexosyltransferase n=1 Tax=Anisakis simplex TaxID=6269 RepID=A0A0M3JX52_ANISI|nr:unnamed protein product [Anisakis simplex]